MSKRIVYVDMDNVLVDFPSGIEKLSKEDKNKYNGNYDEVPGIFSLMEPKPGAIEGFKEIAKTYDTYILSTAPWGNRTAWSDKLDWVKKYLGDVAHKRLILSHNKNLNRGNYLIDDRTKNGAGEFQGELIHFGTADFPHWKSVTDYLLGESESKNSIARLY